MSAISEQRTLAAVMFTDMMCHGARRGVGLLRRSNDLLFGKDEA